MDQGIDNNVFEGLFRLHYRTLCGFALGYVKDADQAEDIVQELFARLWQDRDGLLIKGAVKSYLFTAVRNRCLNALTVKKRMRTLNEGTDDLVMSEERGEDELAERAARVQAVIEALPTERRKIFRMSRNEGLKYQEIADQLGLSVKTVENQMGKALKTLREELADLMPLALLGWAVWEWFGGGWG
ncbi:MAG: RNA polymerase sigma-70 factor [Flavobacteriales bacterium]